MTTGLFAQPDSPLPDSEVEVIKGFKARLDDAEMLDVPLLEEEKGDDRTFIRDYKLSTQPIELQYPAPTMRPLAMPGEENPEPYHFFAKLGYGIQNNPFGELALHLDRDRLRLLVNGSYDYVRGLDNEEKTFEDILGQLAVEYDLNDRSIFNFDLSYNRQVRGIYGLPFIHDPNEMSQFIYSNPELSAGIRSSQSGYSGIDCNLNYKLRNINSNHTYEPINEWNHNLSGELKKFFNDIDLFLSIRGEAELNSFSSDNFNNINTAILGLFGGGHGKKWNFQGGLDVGFIEDDIRFLPQAELLLTLKPIFQPYIGVRSGLRQNNFYELTRLNPYIYYHEPLRSNTFSEYYIGSKGGDDRGKYEVRAGYKLSRDEALYTINFRFEELSFYTVLDDIETFSLALKGEIKPATGWNLGAEVIWNSYTTEDENEAWHLPKFEWKVFGQYDQLLQKKLILKAQIHSLSGIQHPTFNEEGEKLKAFYNLNIKADYIISSHFSAFIHVLNALDNKAERYLSLDQVGINPRMGIRLKF